MKQLFLCHHREQAAEVEQLADALRLYGIKPWLDRQGGFQLGDSFTAEAKRAIRDDCFGLLFYATPATFERPFIRKIELNEAVQRRERDPNFVIITVLRGMTVLELGELSRRHLGVDLSMYHAHPLPEFDAKPGSLEAPMADLAARIIPRVLHQAAEHMPSPNTLMFQCSTRELLPDDPDDALTIDATRLFAERSVAHTATWNQLAAALFLIKQQISQHMGRPRLRVHGSKHLTTATLLGHVFRAASGFQLELRQKEVFWATDYPPIPTPPFTVVEAPGSYHTESLFVEIDALNKPVRDSVRRYIQQTDIYPTISLRFNRVAGPLGQGAIDNAICCAMAWQIRHAISATIAQNEIADIHLFGTMPQSLAMMIGYHLNALRPVQLYEYIQGDYQPSYRLSADQL